MQITLDLPNPLVARHLDPCLACDPKSLAFGVDLAEQIQRKINIHRMFGSMLSGEVHPDVFPPCSALCDLLDLNLGPARGESAVGDVVVTLLQKL